MTQSLYEYQLEAPPGAPGLIADGWSAPRLLHRTLAGGRRKQQTDPPITVAGFSSTSTPVFVEIDFTSIDNNQKRVRVEAEWSSTVNSNERAAYVLASKLMEDVDFAQVAVAYPVGDKLFLEARQFGTDPLIEVYLYSASFSGG